MSTPATSRTSVWKSAIVILVGATAAIYLINPTAGIFEILPDNLPLVGNLDEAAATALLISAFAYFGINIVPFLGAFKKTDAKDPSRKP